jgi:hypothetical protein
MCQCQSPMKRFRFDYARFAPFLLSKGRRVIPEATRDHLHSIPRIHTDGVLTTNNMDSLNVGVNIGQFKMKSGNAVVSGKKKNGFNLFLILLFVIFYLFWYILHKYFSTD